MVINIETGENDSRTDPLHAKKMAALLQTANPEGNPALLLIRSQSGHTGGTTLTANLNSMVDNWAFLMYYLDMEIPE